jgi:dienelactone hydrolase
MTLRGAVLRTETKRATDRRTALPHSLFECTTQSRSYFFRYPFILTHSLSPSASLRQSFTSFAVTCAFAHANLDVNVAFSEAGEVSRLTITPVGSIEQQYTAKYEPPAYVNQDTFKEQEVQVGQGEWVLPGTLSLPVGNGPFAVVVLVHGSGPQDRDETIGPNKPFRDLAWGLATQGIAVLRYDKRTRVYGEKMQEIVATITVKEEVIDDVLNAVALLLHDIPQLNPQRLFVLGHSLGGYLLPRIGAADGEIAGLIVLAGLCRPLEDTILDQFTYIFSLSGTLSAE